MQSMQSDSPVCDAKQIAPWSGDRIVNLNCMLCHLFFSVKSLTLVVCSSAAEKHVLNDGCVKLRESNGVE
ncbi:hypothetical protein T11_9420 [Trichinella zimbabwensis]|uniref:Uncharacterized protein n=1 Tax=Trichinella zimbabwensis TaxID=268475 RepID=A0A0V1H3E7_9BILA|nr:hypothetical protein T11_9420 [Trichinella zimbabwensis]